MTRGWRLFRRQDRPVFTVGTYTDRGDGHERNEDAYLADPENGRFAVADGMGGHPAGDVAARTAIEEIPALLDSWVRPGRRTGPALVRAVLELNDIVLGRALAQPECTDMGTTLVLAQLIGRTAYVVNVGDSRAYLLGSKGFRRLTEDQTFAAELVHGGVLDPESAQRHPFARAIAHAIGRQDIRPDVVTVDICEGDRLMLCSDGLFKSLADEQLAAILASEPDPERACRTLTSAARAAGERDDVSVIVVRCD